MQITLKKKKCITNLNVVKMKIEAKNLKFELYQKYNLTNFK